MNTADLPFHSLLSEYVFATDYVIVDWVALTLLVLSAFLAIRIRDLLGASVMLGIFSLLMALLYLLLDAPDVALTEAAVGAGISTILFLCTLSFTEREQKKTSLRKRIIPLLLVVITGSALVYATIDLPPFGSADAPIHQNTTPYFIENMDDDIDIPNIVTAILASYRGFDTMGEVAVVFTAAIAMAALLMNMPTMRRTTNAPNQSPAPIPPQKQTTAVTTAATRKNSGAKKTSRKTAKKPAPNTVSTEPRKGEKT